MKRVLVALGLVLALGVVTAAVEPEFRFPRIQGHGKIVPLPDAAQPPRDGAQLLVDVTAAGDPSGVHPALEKLARYVNLYAGAGPQPAQASIVAVFHGQATSLALNDQAFTDQHGVPENPNGKLIAQLTEAGVKLYVCGQALAHQGLDPKQVRDEFTVAVSALTVSVNHQQEGYAYVPLP